MLAEYESPMNRKILVVLAIVVVLAVAAVLALPMMVNTEKFRPMIEARGKAAVGRQITFGDLQVSLWRGGVVVNDIKIADDPAFSRDPFLQAKSLTVGVEMLPLIISQDVRVTSVALEEPQITLRRSNAGKWNYESLGATGQTASGTKEKKQPFSIQDLRIEHGRITVVQSNKQHVYDDVNITLKNFSDTSSFPFSLDAKGPGGGTISVEGEAGPMAAGDLSRTPMHGTVKLEQLDIGATGLVAPDSGVAGIVDYDGTAKSDSKILHSEGNATIKNFRAVKGGQAARQNVNLEYSSDMDLIQKKGKLTRGNLVVGHATNRASITGDFDARGNTMLLNGRLKATNMPLDALEGILPAFGVVLPAGTQLQGGTVNADLAFQGPIDRLVTSGPVNIANAKLAGFNLKSHASGIAALAGMSNASDLLIQTFASKLRMAPDGIHADGIQLILPTLGLVAGDGVIGSNNSLNFKMRAKLNGGGGLIGQMSNLSALGQARGELPFRIAGTTQNPIFLPDIGGMMTNSIKAPAQGVQGIGGMLNGIFGKKKN